MCQRRNLIIYDTIHGKILVRENWQIWQIVSHSPKFSSPIFTDTLKCIWHMHWLLPFHQIFPHQYVAFNCMVCQNFWGKLQGLWARLQLPWEPPRWPHCTTERSNHWWTLSSLNYTQEEISTKYETVVKLTPASKRDLEWWIDLQTTPLGALVYHPDPTITIHSDASNKGWGAVLNGQSQMRAYGPLRRQLTI